jgi:hypothetical protein
MKNKTNAVENRYNITWILGIYDDTPCKKMSSFVTLLLLLVNLFST